MALTIHQLDKPGVIYQSSKISESCFPVVDCHVHTNWTDGEGSVQDVYLSAVNAGLSTVLYSEHSRKSSVDWFHRFAKQVRSLPTDYLNSYVGTEVKVDSMQSTIDSCPEIISLCDFIMVSVHRFVDDNNISLPFNEIPKEFALDLEFKLSLSAIKNRDVHILGHPFGMSIRRFKQTPPDSMFFDLITYASKHDVAIEINSYYHDNPRKILHMCQQCDAFVSFGSNAHKLSEIGTISRLMNQSI